MFAILIDRIYNVLMYKVYIKYQAYILFYPFIFSLPYFWNKKHRHIKPEACIKMPNWNKNVRDLALDEKTCWKIHLVLKILEFCNKKKYFKIQEKYRKFCVKISTASFTHYIFNYDNLFFIRQQQHKLNKKD